MFDPRSYYDETDLDAMRALLQAGRAAKNGTFYVHPGDLNWWWYYGDPKKIFAQRAFLWERDGQVIGWTLIAYGAMDVYVAPPLRGTPDAAAMYVWAEERLAEFTRQEGGKEIETIWVGEQDAWLIGHLEGRGFVRDGRCVRGPEPRPGELRRVPIEKRLGTLLTKLPKLHQAPIYDPELDVVAVTPDGEITAFTICWLDPVNGIGHFEPVGTHPDYQRKGLGRAVLYEGMRRMKARGMQTASVCVEGDNPAGVGVYAAAGFEVGQKILTYRKEVHR
jgi:ribosomal protein S18 acetylase RimI-like enzyme